MSQEDKEDGVTYCPYEDCRLKICCDNLACGITRCGRRTDTNQPLDPHMSQENSEQLRRDGKLEGCGRPIEMKLVDGNVLYLKCDWSKQHAT